jgi:hypothetical protein
MNMNIEARNQPQTIPAGPAGMEKARVLAIDGNKPIMLNAMPNTSIIVKLRFSCSYVNILYQHKSYSTIFPPLVCSPAALMKYLAS